MKNFQAVVVVLGIILGAMVGCGDGGQSAPSSDDPVSTDLQSDLWHDHRHVHDGIQLHDHEHESGFVGGHDHPHGHAHRHAETPLDGTVISLARVATPGQLQGETREIPRGLHLEVLEGLPEALKVCLVTETAESGWSYWGDDVPEITVEFEVLGERFSLKCVKKEIPGAGTANRPIAGFQQQLPTSLRDGLSTGDSRVRISEFCINIGNSRFRAREQLYFKNRELSVSLQ